MLLPRLSLTGGEVSVGNAGIPRALRIHNPRGQSRHYLRQPGRVAVSRRPGDPANPLLPDAGVIFGTGFAPYTGGPMNYLTSGEH